MPDSADGARSEVAQTARVLSRLGYLDLMGHVSARVPGTDALAITPGYGAGAPPPGRLRPEDVLVVDAEDQVREGQLRPPVELPLHREIYRGEIYRARGDVQAVICASPPNALAFGMVGREVLPLTHTLAELAYQGAATYQADGLVTTPARGAALARSLGKRPICHVPGVSLVVVGGSLLEALQRCDGFEYLARMSVVMAGLTDAPRVVSADEAAAVPRQRPKEAVPSRDPRRYYASLDDPAAPDRSTWEQRLPAPATEIERTRQRVALACRILDRQGTLVAFFEHVSHRIAGDAERFLMSPAKYFAHMEPDDIGLVGMAGDCAWLEGPYPPAPFRWYHRDILQARPDVQAIVHTHELYGRVFVLAKQAPRPVFRNGALLAQRPFPVFPTPSLVFSEEDRRDTIELLGSGPTVHTLAHGTDFVASSLEQATVEAIHQEELCAMEARARQLGQPALLSPGVLEDLRQLGPTAEDWWAYYAAQVA